METIVYETLDKKAPDAAAKAHWEYTGSVSHRRKLGTELRVSALPTPEQSP